jgi:hypothetical protein
MEYGFIPQLDKEGSKKWQIRYIWNSQLVAMTTIVDWKVEFAT